MHPFPCCVHMSVLHCVVQDQTCAVKIKYQCDLLSISTAKYTQCSRGAVVLPP